jgi:hypothetical protein
MLTTRMSPKISVNPLATTKYSAASVSPLRVTVVNCRRSAAALNTRKIATTAAPATSAIRLAGHAVGVATGGRLISGGTRGRPAITHAPLHPSVVAPVRAGLTSLCRMSAIHLAALPLAPNNAFVRLPLSIGDELRGEYQSSVVNESSRDCHASSD